MMYGFNAYPEYRRVNASWFATFVARGSTRSAGLSSGALSFVSFATRANLRIPLPHPSLRRLQVMRRVLGPPTIEAAGI